MDLHWYLVASLGSIAHHIREKKANSIDVLD